MWLSALRHELFQPVVGNGFKSDNKPPYAEHMNFTIQRKLGNAALLTVGYVGTQGHRLLASYDINHGNPQTCNDLQAISVAAIDPSLACGSLSADNAYTIAANEIPAGFTFHLPYGPTSTVTGPNPNPITLVGLRKYSSPN